MKKFAYLNWTIYIFHYNDAIMGAMESQITSPSIVYSSVYSCADQRKHQSSASLAFVRGIHRSPVNSPNKWPVTRKLFPFDDVIIIIKQKPSAFHITQKWHISPTIIYNVKIGNIPHLCPTILTGTFLVFFDNIVVQNTETRARHSLFVFCKISQ